MIGFLKPLIEAREVRVIRISTAPEGSTFTSSINPSLMLTGISGSKRDRSASMSLK
jgi:hypothetical protein